MHTDFPAAHSMDTTWYAIDQRGHVASFWSGEAGAVPLVMLHDRWPTLPESLWDWLRQSGEDRLFHYEHAHRFEYSYQIPAGELWLHDGPRVSGPYFRQELPSRPLHVDQLPPQLRAFVASVRFGLSFADEQAVQPAELTPCASDQSDYLTLAGERRPFPPDNPGRPW